ncbi:outer membrane protein TOM13-domain-containing protein [Kalaharituber pfeilii]|nr:outer membrane protein TOM13-domain-containing protein [Kalaharituber pfeilii]
MSSQAADVPHTSSSLLHEDPSNSHNAADSDSQSSTSTSSPLVLYRPPTVISILKTAAINLVLPFINGLMLGFGELFAHEIAFRLGWGSTRVFPLGRRTMGPGVEIRSNNTEQDRRRGQQNHDLQHTTSLE